MADFPITRSDGGDSAPSRSADSVIPRPHRRRRRAIIGVVALALIAALVVILPAALAPVVQRKLEAMVSNHLHARLEVGSLSYRFPYGVSVRDAKFVTDESHDGVQLLTVKALDISLAKLPIGSGPIVIKSFTVVDPVVHLVRREDGTVVGSHLTKRASDSPRPKERIKLSDLLQLREFTLRGAAVIFEDRKHPDAKPMEWRDIDAKMQLSPQSGSRYRFSFTAASKPVANIELNGAVDVDTLIVDIERLAVAADVRNDATSSPMPAQLQRILQRLGIEGSVRFEASGQVPMREPRQGGFAVNVILDRVRAQPTGQAWALDELSAKFHAERRAGSDSKQIDFRLSDVSARGMGALLGLQGATGTVDLDQKTWRVDGLSGQVSAAEHGSERKFVLRYVERGRIDFDGGATGSFAPGAKRIERAELLAKIDRLSILPPKFREPLEAITGTIRLAGDRATLQNITALYGNDRLAINQALITLGDLPTRIEVLNILASAEFGTPAAQYPAPLDVAMEQLCPTGKIDIQGAAALYKRGNRLEPDYSLQIIPQGARVALLNQRMPVTNIQGEISVAPRLIEAKYIHGEAFGGKIALRGNMVPRSPMNYDGELRTQDADLSLVSTAFGLLKPDGSPKLTGRAVAKVRVVGQIPRKGEGDPLQSLVARGRVSVKEGNFWSLPVLDGIVNEIRFARNAITAGEAAMAFEIKDGKLELSKVAINSPALGVQGSGTIELTGEKKMDLTLVVAPLGDWRRKIRRTNIPLVSDLAGDIAGGLQKMINSATSQLLYEFRVTGHAGEPKLSAVPAPILTNSAASLFGMMMRGTGADRLIDAIAGKDTDEPKPEESNSGG
ncbi:MAG: hypothetical protein H7Z14_14610 [Anaerolineae bacterium]|nr:hypothetical protein [Phycisphaerae bacterium]